MEISVKKRIIAIFIILAISSMAVPAFATSTDNGEAVFLSENGILIGSNGDLMLDQKFSVEQLMTVLARLMGEDEIAINYPIPPSFTDIPKDRWSAPYIAWAESKGLIKGNGDGTVGYSDNVNTQRLSMFLLRVLGYKDIPWDKAFEVAAEKELLSNVNVSAVEQVTRGDVAKIVFSALEVEDNNGITLGEKLGIELSLNEQTAENKGNLTYDFGNYVYRSNTGSKLIKKLIYSVKDNSISTAQTYTYTNGIITGGTSTYMKEAKENYPQIMTFNSDGNLLEITVYFSPEEKQLASIEHYEWSEGKQQNILVPEKWEPRTPEIKLQNIYDSSGKLIEQRSVFGWISRGVSDNFSVIREYSPNEIRYFSYGSDGELIQIREWRDPLVFEASKEFIYKYIYDELGNIVEEYGYYDGKFEDKIKYTYNYDNAGRIEEIIKYDLLGTYPVIRQIAETDESTNLYTRYHFSYNQDGNLVEFLSYGRSNELLGRSTYEYE